MPFGPGDVTFNTPSHTPSVDQIGVMPNLRRIITRCNAQLVTLRRLIVLCWAFIIIVAGLMFTPEGWWCIVCGPQAPGYVGYTVVRIIALGLLLTGLAGLNGMLTVDRVGSVRKLLSRSA